MIFDPPHLSYERVGEYVKDFLQKHHPSLTLPIPIEWIIESGLGVNIYPFPNLYRIFNQSGFLGRSRKVIYVDEYQYDNFVQKYRFTLAHEVGHFVMHESLYEELSFDSEQDFMEWLQSRPRTELGWFETHANWFAGQLLVPTGLLSEHCVALLESNRGRFPDNGYIPNEFWSYASNELAEPFDVSPTVIEIRIRQSSLSEKHKDYYQKK